MSTESAGPHRMPTVRRRAESGQLANGGDVGTIGPYVAAGDGGLVVFPNARLGGLTRANVTGLGSHHEAEDRDDENGNADAEEHPARLRVVT
jgi:hypothetical protein